MWSVYSNRLRYLVVDEESATFWSLWATPRPSTVPAAAIIFGNEINSKMRHFLVKLMARAKKRCPSENEKHFGGVAGEDQSKKEKRSTP